MKNRDPQTPKRPNYFTPFVRGNAALWFFQNFVSVLSSYPALLVEIFTREKFGERYMSFASCLTAAAIVLSLGVVWTGWQDLIAMLVFGRSHLVEEVGDIDLGAVLLFVYTVAFLIKAWRHRKEWKREGRTLDFERLSISNGLTTPRFRKLVERLPKRLRPWAVNYVTLWRYYEPLAAILAGLVFLIILWTRTFGATLLLCGIFYFWRTGIQFSWGRNALLNQIDEKILAEEAANVFLNEKPPEETRGVTVYAPLPADRKLREQLVADIENAAVDDDSDKGVKVSVPNPAKSPTNGQE